MLLSIIVPCYNEDETINPLIKALLEIYFAVQIKIIVVDDGSKKNQINFISEFIREKKLDLFFCTYPHI